MAVQQRATLDDVARLAGVSSKTVSRVYADRDRVSPETAERVLAAAKRLRFRPNALARTLRKGGASRTVGFLMGDLSNPFYYKVAAGIESELGRHGFALVVATTDDTTDGEERVAEALLAQRVSALLIIPVASDQSHLEGERQLGTPVIAIDRPARNLVADSVILQNRHGAYTATAHLLAQGHRRIAYACNPADVFTQMERLRGYRDAMAEYGIRDTADLEFCADDPRLAPESLVGELLDHADPATAVVTGNNRMTIGALRAFRARPGREAPALVGFDDFDTADILGVSVVTYDPVELGRRAAQLAMERVADPSGFSQQIELPTWLVPRGSGERRPSAGADR